jgi:hypothetical protein
MAKDEASTAYQNTINGSSLKGDQFNAGGVNNHFLANYKEDDIANRIYTDLLQLDMVNLKKLTPYQPGRGYFIPTRMPKFMEDQFEDQTKFFKTLLIGYCVGFDGITDPTMNFSEVTSGVESQTMDVANNVTGLTREVTMRFPAELRGQFLTRYQYNWMTGIMDPYTDRGRYHGADLEYTNANHTMSGVYFTLDPSESAIEFSAYLLNMMPKNAQLSINNKNKGENTPPEITTPYSCQFITNNKMITDKCYEFLEEMNGEIGGVTSKADNIEFP